LKEIPTLANTHKGLQPVAERVPQESLVVDLAVKGREPGVHGGDLDTLIGRSKDKRLINVWGYARLVGYDQDLELVPDLLKDIEVEDGASFTLTLRKGHKWSDGAPFTAEDFRYWWEDNANNEELAPSGPPPFMLVDGKPPVFEILDEATVRYTWDAPNPIFLPALAASRPPFIYRPSHYLKTFNPKYGDPDAIQAMADAARVRNWAPLHNLRDDMYDGDNIEIPSLQPWITSAGGSDRRVIMVRNPYFHRVTTTGDQLPYIDRVVMTVVDDGLIATKTQAGETDLQARGLNFADIAVLKRGEAKGYQTRLWPDAKANAIALYPNLTTTDATWRELLRDARFRHALSLAIDRDLINRVLFFGLATPSNNYVLPESPLYKEADRTLWAGHDVAKANALLDEMGLTERSSDGIRHAPDGRKLELIVETAGENEIEIDALELIRDMWNEVGIGLHSKPSQRDVLRNRAFSGELVMSVWSGYDNGIPTANMSPEERVPVSTIFLSGPAWGAFHMSGGETGTEPDYPLATKLFAHYEDWRKAESEEEQHAAWTAILDLHAEETLSIGTVAGVSQPVVVSSRLHNVPEKAIYGWDPGAQFGIYRMDEFWLDPAAR
jgi:peptide/nickel transport system substrate-binding protein